MLVGLVNAVISAIGAFGRFIGLLPASPFQNIGTLIPPNPAMDIILWILPITQMLVLVQLWLAAIGMYYLVKVPLRWVRVVKS
ncbi:MAG: hypothetical protein FWF79_03180 [Defluviitaleaceae bacterium]|nr:hypothetical protein [Defluviitaleaceae bacterium]